MPRYRLARLLLAGIALLSVPLAARTPDWVRSYTVSPVRGYVIGNPEASLKLVEFLSFTCNHCAEFWNQAIVPLKRDYVASGKLSLEIRHAVRDRFDLVAAMLARCDGPRRFFEHSEAILAAQPQWLARAQVYERTQAEAIAKLSGPALLVAAASGSGLESLMIRRGMTAEKVRRCLTDPAQQQAVATQTHDAWNVIRIRGTPGFLLNGELLDRTASWATLQPQIDSKLN